MYNYYDSCLVTTSVCSTFGGDRTCYRIEAVWDSSLHNSELLNRPGGQIWLTVSVYIEISNCTQPVCISRDMCVQVKVKSFDLFFQFLVQAIIYDQN